MSDEAQKAYDKAIAQAGTNYREEEFQAKKLRDETATKTEVIYHNRLVDARENYQKAMRGAKQFDKATTIQNALSDLVAIECPHCNSYIDIPSLEDIQNWLEENEQ